MKVAVLGGTGTVGAHIAYAMVAAGYEVRIAFPREELKQHVKQVFSLYGVQALELVEKLEWVEVEGLCSQEVVDLLQGCEVAVNAAASVELGAFRGEAARRFIRYNRLLASSVVEAALQARVRRLIHIGSIAVLGGGEQDHWVEEDSIQLPEPNLSPYALGKIEAEREVLRGWACGLEVAILNPGVVLAPYIRREGSGALTRIAASGIPIYPTGILAWVDARDVAAVAVKAVEARETFVRATLVGGHSSYREVFSTFASAIGKPAPRVRIPYWGVWVMRPAVTLLRWMRILPKSLNWGVLRAAYSRVKYRANRVKNDYNLAFKPLEETMLFCLKNGMYNSDS